MGRHVEKERERQLLTYLCALLALKLGPCPAVPLTGIKALPGICQNLEPTTHVSTQQDEHFQ